MLQREVGRDSTYRVALKKKPLACSVWHWQALQGLLVRVFSKQI